VSAPRDVPGPEQRVREFVESLPDSHDLIEEYAHGRPLNATDLRDVLNELDAWRAAAENAGVTA